MRFLSVFHLVAKGVDEKITVVIKNYAKVNRVVWLSTAHRLQTHVVISKRTGNFKVFGSSFRIDGISSLR